MRAMLQTERTYRWERACALGVSAAENSAAAADAGIGASGGAVSAVAAALTGATIASTPVKAETSTTISPSFSLTPARLKEAALELLWPTRCAVCDKPGDLVCDTCRRALRFYDPWLACATCGAPFGRFQCCECNSHTLARRGQGENDVLFCSSAVLFNAASGSIVRCYKDSGEQRLSSFLAKAMENALSPETWTSFDALAFIPNSQNAYIRRGFDHMEKIAREISRDKSIPLLNAFERPQAVDQRQLSQIQRQENAGSAFRLRRAQQQLRLPNNILLIDDVMTTGATLRAAARTLKACDSCSVQVLTFARVV